MPPPTSYRSQVPPPSNTKPNSRTKLTTTDNYYEADMDNENEKKGLNDFLRVFAELRTIGGGVSRRPDHRPPPPARCPAIRRFLSIRPEARKHTGGPRFWLFASLQQRAVKVLLQTSAYGATATLHSMTRASVSAMAFYEGTN